MSTADLGPLENSLLRTLTAIDSLGVGGTRAEALWRLCPYGTALANVQAALGDGQPLRRAVALRDGHVGLVDRTAALAAATDREGAARRQLQELQGPLAGLSKLPWVEGIAVAGATALGSWIEGEPVELVILAEGGRDEAAGWAVARWLGAAGSVRAAVRVVAVLDADRLEQEPLGQLPALLWATLRPVTNRPAWVRLRTANGWIDEALPNGPSQPWEGLVLPESHGRLDGRLAALRRRVLGADQELLTSQTRRGRRRGLVEQLLGDRLQPAADARDWLAERVAAFEARWRQVQGWDAPPTADATPRNGAEPPGEDGVGDEAAPGPVATPIEETRAERPQPAPAAPTSPPSPRRRGPQRRPLLGRAAATGETGLRRARRAPAGRSRRR